MKKGIFSKLIACFVVLSCAFVVSACSIFQKEDTNIKSIVIDEDSIPEVIVVGGFDDAGIKAIVTYEDETTSEIDVTTEMIPAEYQDLLETPGIYKISIMFRNATTKLTVRMVNSTNLYQVNFYNNKEQLITTQFVYDGEDATLPSDVMSSVEGWALVGWDRSHENISEDTNIYGVYVNVENTLSDAKMQQVLLNAEQYYITNSHFTSVEGVTTYYDQTSTSKQTINYHYDTEKQMATSQTIETADDDVYIFIFGETEAEMWYRSVDEGNDYYKVVYEDMRAEWDEEFAEMSFEQMVTISKLYGGENVFSTFTHLIGDNIEYSYELSANKLIYICTITTIDSWETGRDVETCTIKYDDEKILQIVTTYTSYYNEEIRNSYNRTYSIDYTTIEFEEDLIPNFGDVNSDGLVNETDMAMLEQYLAGTITLTEEQLFLADVSLDNEVTEYDHQLFELFLDNKIPHLPLSEEYIIDELFELLL